MINSKLFTLFFTILFISLHAQEEEVIFQSIEDGFQRDKIIFSLSLLSQLDVNSPSIQFGLDIKLSEAVGLHQELGYINNWLNPFYGLLDQHFSQNNKLKNGVKYILEPRFYPFKKDRKISKSIFFAPSFDFRYVNIKRNAWVNRYNFSYRQKMDFNVNKIVLGGMAKFGFTSKPNKLMPIDFVIGIGARQSVKTNTLPEDANLLIERSIFPRTSISGTMWHPSIYYGMLLHLPIKKK